MRFRVTFIAEDIAQYRAAITSAGLMTELSGIMRSCQAARIQAVTPEDFVDEEMQLLAHSAFLRETGDISRTT